MNTPHTVGHVGWSPDYKSTPDLSQLRGLCPSDTTPCSACLGVLKRTEHPEYFNGFTDSGGACWTSSKTETLRVDSKDIARIIAKIAASPWLRTMEGLRWEYLPNVKSAATGSERSENE